MKVEVHRTAAPWSDAAQRTLERAVRRIEASARRYPAFWSELQVYVRAHDGVERIRVALTLDGDEVAADATGTDPHEVLGRAFDELFDRFDLYRLRVNRTLRERVEQRRRERLQPPLERFDGAVVERLYPVVLRAAQHEIAVRQADGDLEPGLVDPVELADSVFAEGLAAGSADLSLPDAAARLEERLVEILDGLCASLQTAIDEERPLDADVSDFAVSPLGEEIEELWTLDEVGFDETLVDPDRDVEDLWATAELREVLTQALFRLDDGPRRVFSQVVIDGWPVDAVAAATGRRIEDVRGEVFRTAHDLARRLSIGETVWSAERVTEVFAALGKRLRDERREVPAVRAE